MDKNRHSPFTGACRFKIRHAEIGGRMVIDGLVKKQEVESEESGKNHSE
jgi:hypothetical protein